MKQLDYSATETASEPPSEEPATHRSWLHRTFAGSYRVEAVLGEGAMGQVLLARDIHLDRSVAIKVLKADTAERIQNDQRFRREARVLSRLNHPNVVTLYAFGTLEDGTGYIVMERVSGAPLTAYCESSGLMDFEQLGSVIEQICMALSAAHRQGIVHRDIKPTNVLIGGMDTRSPFVKVLDFGLAKPLDGPSDPSATTDLLATSEGAAIGTPAYMSPEQACGDVVDGRADIYGLACLTMQLLTGHLPFGGLQGTQMVMAHVQQEPRLPSQLRQGPEFLPGGPLDRVMACALAKDPSDRFGDAMEFSTALLAALRGEHADGFDPMQTGPVTGAFDDTKAGGDSLRSTAFGVTQVAGGTVEAEMTILPSVTQHVVLHLELESLTSGQSDVQAGLIGDALAIVEARARSAIEHEGGTVMGGLVGALKGAFTADSSPSRAIEAAVQSALAIRKMLQGLQSDPLLGAPFQPRFRIGLELGELFVGSNFAGEVIAHGAALSGALAMARGSQDGEIRLSKRCYRLARGRFHYTGATAFESRIGPAVVGLLSAYQPSVTEIHGVEIPLVGREHEVKRLRAVLDDALDLMPGGRILIESAPGVGKTRLVAHTVDSFVPDDRLLLYESGQCTIGGHNIPYRPFVQVIRSRAGVVQDDDGAQIITKIERLMERWLLRDGETAGEASALSDFLTRMLGVSTQEVPPADGQDREPDLTYVQDGLTEYYTRLLERAPVLLFIDDFMHASPQTRDLVQHLVQRFADDPFTTIICARTDPGVRLAHYLSLEGSSPPIELLLPPLSEADTRALVRAALTRATSVPDSLVAEIARLASGVPQIVVEAMYDLIESNVIEVEGDVWTIDPQAQHTVRLPESAEELFRERVQRLSPAQRDLVEIAAVAGDVFWPDLLASQAHESVRQQDIRALVEGGFFRAKRDALVDGNQGYGFAQVAMAESVYRNTPVRRRKELHRSIASWLESLGEAEAKLDHGLIGSHYRTAERHAEALPYLAKTGERALAQGSLQEATRYLKSALSSLSQIASSELSDAARRERARAVGSDLMTSHVRSGQLEEALELSKELLGPGGLLAGTDPSENYRILLGRADALAQLSRHTEARTVYNSVFRLLGESLTSRSALEARLGSLMATRHIDGASQARAQFDQVLSQVDMSVRQRPDVAPVISKLEAQLVALSEDSTGGEHALD